MKNTYYLITLCIALLYHTHANAQTPNLFNRLYYTDTSYLVFRYVNPLPDGFLTVTGTQKSPYFDILAQKYDLKGNHIWTKSLWKDTVGIAIWEDFVINEDIYYTLLVNATLPGYPYSRGYHLIQFDTAGTVQWHKTYFNKTYPTTAVDYMSEIVLIPNEGFLTVGLSKEPDIWSKHKIYAAKFNNNGEQLWEKTYAPDTSLVDVIWGLYTNAWAGLVDDDGNYVLYCTKHGGYYPFPLEYSDKCDLYLIKLNPEGEVIWERPYGLPGTNVWHYQDIVLLPNGNYLAMVTEDSMTYVYKGLHIVEVDKTTGDVVWEKWLMHNEGNYYNMSFDTHALAHDGTIIFAGTWRNDFGGGSWHGAIMKLNLQGDTIWMRFLPDAYATGSPLSEVSGYPRSIAAINDGETYVIAGEVYDYAKYRCSAWLLTIDENGYTCGNYVCDTVSGVKPPPGTNSPSGGQGGFTLTPNPTHQTATIAISPALLNPNSAALQIFDTQGRLVNTITLSGSETTTFSTANLTSGIYYCRLQNHPETTGVKMVVW